MMDDRLADALGRLSDLQRSVIRMRFGLDGADPTSLQATAESLGIGVRRVRRAEEEALATLSVDVDVLGVYRPDEAEASFN